jgi:hypothetical protein
MCWFSCIDGSFDWHRFQARLLPEEWKRYTLSMDSVRFGRALGIGARLAAKTAAKTMVSAMDAATAPNPSAETNKADTAQVPGARPAMKEHAARTTAQVMQTGQGLKEGGRRFNEAFSGRVIRLSGALWLELTGVFFGIFALSAGLGAWRMRAGLHQTAANPDAHSRFLVAILMTGVFGYFCVSSFIKANRRTRGR